MPSAMATNETEYEEEEEVDYAPYNYQQMMLQTELLKVQNQLLARVESATTNLWRFVYIQTLVVWFVAFVIGGTCVMPILGTVVGVVLWLALWLIMRAVFKSVAKQVPQTAQQKKKAK